MKSELPSRVLMTADTVGGVWSYALELCRSLAEWEVEVHLATLGAPLRPDQWKQVSLLRNVEVHESRWKLEWMPDPWADVERAGEWLLSLEEKTQPDLIHLNGYAHGALGWRAPKLVVGHSCVLSWWQSVKGENAPPQYDEYRRRVRQGLESADAVVAPSHAMMKSLAEHYGGAFRNAVVIPNGRDPLRYQPASKENFILSAGRLWDEAKNIGAVCACASNLPWKICIAGDTRAPQGGSADLGSTEYLGRLDEPTLRDYLRRAGIYALPALYEPFGLSVLEAALCGCALVLGDIPSLRENWDHAALFVSPHDTSSLEENLLNLIEDPEKRRSLAHAARERGLKLNPKNSARKYVDLYSLMLNPPQPQTILSADQPALAVA
jgi:glycosyltransferase involved in cell wall biosynthesis